MASSKKRRRIIVFAVLGFVVIGGGILAKTRKREVVITVQTEKVAPRTIHEIIPANGKIQPVVQVKISPEVSGEITELPVKEGQPVKKGDLLLRIKPDVYVSSRNQAQASYESSVASQATAEANLRKAEADFRRGEGLFKTNLISESDFDTLKASFDVAKAQLNSARHQVDMAHASLANAEEQLAKTTIVSPRSGTITKLNSELGERVLGTVQNVGTDIMTISDLNEMEARVDVGETDVVLIKPGQAVKLEVDAFKDHKFQGVVTEIANSAKGSGTALAVSSSTSQEATKFEVRIRIKEKEEFRPGMSVTAEIETRSRTNVLAVPIASVTTRLPKDAAKKPDGKGGAGTNAPAQPTNVAAQPAGTNAPGSDKKSKEANKPIEVVFLMEGDHAKMAPVKHGISDDTYYEITEGLQEGQEVISGGYRAIGRDLEDGKKVKKGEVGPENPKDKP
jgi:HlyD family secretion protein